MTDLRRNMTVAEIAGTASTVNSTTTPLGIGGVFTGTAEAILNPGIIYVNVYTDQESATDGLQIQQSSDGTNWDHEDIFTVHATTGKNFSFNAYAKYFRIVYTNGAVGQTVFRLQTIFKQVYGKPSSHRIQDSIVTDDDAELVKAVITGETPGGTFKNVEVTTAGNMKVAIEEFDTAVSSNSGAQLNVTQYLSDGTEVGKVGIVDPGTSLTRYAELDTRGPYQIVITPQHHHVHAGVNFDVVHDVAATTSLIIAFKVAAQTKIPHLVFKWASENAATFHFWEGATWTASTGSTIAPKNSDRTSAVTSILQSDVTGAFVSNGVVLNPTGLATGAAVDLFPQSTWATGAFPPSESGATREERLLNPGETYAFQITQASGGIWLYLDWYEEADE